jgi:hypothetical protein
MYMPLNMDIFHPSMSTRTSGETIFKRFSSFYFVVNFGCMAYGNSSIFAIMFLVTITGTPCTNDFIMFVLDQIIPWINCLTRRWIDMNSKLRRPPAPTYSAWATSLPKQLFFPLSTYATCPFRWKWPFYQKWTLCVTTLALGLQGCGPRGSPGITLHVLGSVGKCEGMNPHTPKATPTLGGGILNFQKAIVRVKTKWIEEFLLSLESFWNLDVYNEFAWPICTFETQVMAKRRVENQIGSLIPNH